MITRPTVSKHLGKGGRGLGGPSADRPFSPSHFHLGPFSLPRSWPVRQLQTLDPIFVCDPPFADAASSVELFCNHAHCRKGYTGMCTPSPTSNATKLLGSWFFGSYFVNLHVLLPAFLRLLITCILFFARLPFSAL